MPETLRLGVLATHPIQYHAPLFRKLASDPRLALRVYFAHRPTALERGAEFGVAFEWDVDLTSGYEHEWLENRSARPGLSEFGGCDTPAIADKIRSGGFDAFLVSGWHSRSYAQAIAACREAGTPALVRGDSQLSRRGPLLERAARRIVNRRRVRQFAACLAVGSRSEEYFRRYGARSIVRAPHFVDNHFFATRAEQSRRDGNSLRARLGVPDSALLAIFAGKLIDKKRPMDVLRAVAAARDAADVRVLVVGDGELRAECEAEARRLDIPAYFVGFLNQTQMPLAYARADVLVLPSDERETWGLVVNEAMASGVPALVSRAAGCQPDMVVEGRTGFSFALGGVSALAGQLALLGTDRALAARLGVGARAHVARYSVDAAAQGVLDGAMLAARRR